MNDDETRPYTLAQRDDRYAVLDGRGESVLESRDRATIEHYVVLMNGAYSSGYRAGYRAGKATSRDA
ncbi:MAG TPA: hypothetical protein ENJ80_13430 [Gammaproteobacteria bacterium]|nr:hypothetical protein [Gammaproteobacteria bacterium]